MKLPKYFARTKILKTTCLGGFLIPVFSKKEPPQWRFLFIVKTISMVVQLSANLPLYACRHMCVRIVDRPRMARSIP